MALTNYLHALYFFFHANKMLSRPIPLLSFLAPAVGNHPKHVAALLFNRTLQFYLRFKFSEPFLGSTIISDNEFYIGNLTQFLAPAVGNNPKWLLCYRASTHGWAVSTFHSSCDGKANTTTIIKVGIYVFGGYTDIPWGKYDFFVLTNTIIRRKGLTLECKCWAGTRISLGINMINKALKNTIIRRKGLTL